MRVQDVGGNREGVGDVKLGLKNSLYLSAL